MKKNLFAFLFLSVFSFCLVAKAQELTVTYTTTYDVHSPSFLAESGVSEDMRSVFASAYKDLEMVFIMKCNENEGELKLGDNIKKQTINIMGQSIDFDIVLAEMKNNHLYWNIPENTYLQKTSFMQKVFLVKDVLPTDTFDIIVGEKKEILGFECQKAESKDQSQIVWFTEHIPMKGGPLMPSNVTGLVLEAHFGGLIYKATAIDESISGKIDLPIGGKEITSNDFMELVRKTNEMMNLGSGQ